MLPPLRRVLTGVDRHSCRYVTAAGSPEVAARYAEAIVAFCEGLTILGP